MMLYGRSSAYSYVYLPLLQTRGSTAPGSTFTGRPRDEGPANHGCVPVCVRNALHSQSAGKITDAVGTHNVFCVVCVHFRTIERVYMRQNFILIFSGENVLCRSSEVPTFSDSAKTSILVP